MAEAKKITRLRAIEADRVDGVDGPANGFPVLMMKMVAATGANDPSPAQITKEEADVPEDAVVETAPEGAEPEQEDAAVEKTSEPEAEAQEDKPEEVSELVKEAIAKATEAQEAAIKELRDELAVLKATPIPGGPSITAPKAALDEQKLAKVAYYERQARLTANDRELSDHYAKLAREARA